MPAKAARAQRTEAQFADRQRRYFDAPDIARFLWQTRQPYVAERERDLLPTPDSAAGGLCLEVGCGEGPNLHHILRHAAAGGPLWVAVDLFFEKVRHAARQVPSVLAVCAEGQRLPFRDARFSHILSRDIFHHVLDKPGLMAEMRRVCVPGGTITLIEANGRNPIIWLFGLLRRAERDVMAMRPEVLVGLLGAEGRDVRLEFFEPFPFYRILFHYRYGLPALAKAVWCRRAIAALEGCLGRVLPKERWAYIRATLRVPDARQDF